MIEGKKMAVVVPAYNEEDLIARVVETMPDSVDRIVVVDDFSTDRTVAVLKELKQDHKRLHVICHSENKGVGGAICTGYRFARDEGYDVTVVMAGDAQMDPDDLPAVAGPVARDEVDYCKGNRLFTGEAYKKIPKVRYFGNAILSLMTKIASGYWHVADSQTGYTAINLKMLKLIDWHKTYKRYGCPNDYLVRLNVYDARVQDVPIQPVYGVGEKSGIKLHRVIPKMTILLSKLFLWRMLQKYVIRDFHPLVLFYGCGIGSFLVFLLLFIRLLAVWAVRGSIPSINALGCGIVLIASLQFILFAMFFDMECNRNLRSVS